MTNIDALVDLFIKSRVSPEEQYAMLVLAFPERRAEFDEALVEFHKRAGIIRRMTPPPLLSKDGGEQSSWYMGADYVPNADFWPRLKEHLLVEKKWTPKAVKSIDDASDKIVAWLEHPSANRFQTRGLVVGYVQSGKTANFTAVIAKAADVGYRLFIVLSGTKVSLRAQTQSRLDKELVELNDTLWYTPTRSSDFSLKDNPNYFLDPDKHSHMLCVVKKNSTVLGRLIKWLSKASKDILNRCPVMIIDDEADEASINTAANQAAGDPETYKRTAINNKLIELLSKIPKAAYIGYTATPFANVLIDPRLKTDLYPRSFITCLPKPDGHFGTELIFGRERLLVDETDDEFEGLDMVREIPVEELPDLQPQTKDYHDFYPQLSPSLIKAVDYFWMACAARWARDQQDQHSTMLVHTTQHTQIHFRISDLIKNHQEETIRTLKGKNAASLLQNWEQQWNDEISRLPRSQFSEPRTEFYELQLFLLDVINVAQVVVDNFRSEQRLNYEDFAKIQIAIGGNTLSRGLTLEGLLVSFFVRAANTYDTLLQMGRWFGYRKNYSDLPRIWMTEELKDHFYDLATIEAEIRRDIERYADYGMTPEQFGVRIRELPELAITARTKMQHAVQTYINYGGKNAQTVLFHHKNSDWLNLNVQAVNSFILQILSLGYSAENHAGHQIFYDIPVDYVVSFIDQYQFHELSREINRPSLKGYITKQTQAGKIKRWNIVLRGIVSKDNINHGSVTVGSLTVPLLNRSRRKNPIEYANIGTLMSQGDTGADLPLERSQFSTMKAEYLREKRQQHAETKDRGLLIIYMISKDSTSRKGGRDLNAEDNLVGLGLVFPPAAHDMIEAVSYVEVNPEHLEQYIEPDDLEEEEAE